MATNSSQNFSVLESSKFIITYYTKELDIIRQYLIPVLIHNHKGISVGGVEKHLKSNSQLCIFPQNGSCCLIPPSSGPPIIRQLAMLQ